MQKGVVTVLLACILMFMAVRFALAQSAEDIIKGQSPGVKYAATYYDDNGRPMKQTIYIRGDEITEVTEPSGIINRPRLMRKLTEGNKLVLQCEDGGIKRDFIIDGDILTSIRHLNGQDFRGIFKRE